MPADDNMTDDSLVSLLRDYSTELTTRDKKSLKAARSLLAPESRVFIAALMKDEPDKLASAAKFLKESGLHPIPHIVARNLLDIPTAERLLEYLAGEAGVDRALVLGGDRDVPAGTLTDSLQLLKSGIFQKHDVRKIAISCYPEGHARIPQSILDKARAEKIAVAEQEGLEVMLVSQFCFEAEPILRMIGQLREEGVTAPIRVGVAGPSDRATLMKYAMMCGIGPSLRVLKERNGLAQNMLAGESPIGILRELADAQAQEPSLGILAPHFFTFGSLAKSADFANHLIAAGSASTQGGKTSTAGQIASV